MFFGTPKCGFKPRPYPTHAKYEVEPPKARIVLGRLTFPALHLWCTLPLMIHPIIVGVSSSPRYFQTTMWEPRDLPSGEISVGWFVRVHSICLPSKGGSSHLGPSNSCNASFEIAWELDQLGNEATPYFTLVATSKMSYFSFRHTPCSQEGCTYIFDESKKIVMNNSWTSKFRSNFFLNTHVIYMYKD